MLTSDLFETILLAPARQGMDKLTVVSGYASPAMATRHLEALPSEVRVELTLGMCAVEGVNRGQHKLYCDIVASKFPGRFSCNYLAVPPQLHAKLYLWSRDGRAERAFLGSANYTQIAFLGPQREAMTTCDPEMGSRWAIAVSSDVVACTDNRALILVTDVVPSPRASLERVFIPKPRPGKSNAVITASSVKLSLLTAAGDPGDGSRLNWGFRPRNGRNKNEAYIHVPAEVSRAGFFPPVGQRFRVITDDGVEFNVVRAQAGGKAIETPENNSLLGAYLRSRVGLKSGAFVTRSDLEGYGRTDIEFTKVDTVTYYMDFSV